MVELKFAFMFERAKQICLPETATGGYRPSFAMWQPTVGNSHGDGGSVI